jgi:hypothetical protein
MSQENLYDMLNLIRGIVGAGIGAIGLVLHWWV